MPPSGFSPFHASPEELDYYGLPAAPDERTQPRKHAFWRRMLGAPLRLAQPVYGFVPDVPPPVRPPSDQEQRAVAGRLIRPFGHRLAPGSVGRPVAASRVAFKRFHKDSNWAGVAITPRDGERFTQVWGSLRVPVPSLPRAGEAMPDAAQHRSSMWVGLGGHRRHSRSLPQVGIAQAAWREGDGREGQATWAWHQWWVRDREFGPIALANFPVCPGDEVICWLAAEDPRRVVHHLKNERTGLLMSLPAVVEDDSAPLDGSAAEWIVERPAHQETHALYPLPAFDPVMFRDCGAESARDGRLGPAGTERDLQGAILIRMARTLPELARTSVVAQPQVIDDASLLVIRTPDAPREARPVERKADQETGSDVAPAPD